MFGGGLSKLSLDGKSDDTKFVGEITSIAKLVDVTSHQLGNFLINDSLYVYGGGGFLDYDPFNHTLKTWQKSAIPFDLGLNKLIKNRDTYIFTQEELKIVLNKEIKLIDIRQIYSVFSKEISTKYMQYLQLYDCLAHDILHLLITDKTKNITEGPVYISETNILLNNTHFLEYIEYYIGLKGYFSSKQTIVEEFGTVYILDQVFTKQDIKSIHSILMQGLDKFIWNSDHLIKPIKNILKGKGYLEYITIADEMCEISKENTKGIIDYLSTLEGNYIDWEQKIFKKLFGDKTIDYKIIEYKINEENALGSDRLDSFKIMKAILQYIYKINWKRINIEYPKQMEILYGGKVSTKLPPIFDLDNEIDLFYKFQKIVKGICEFELNKK